MRVLICGGGVIGAAIAYFLSRRGARPSSSSERRSPVRPPASRADFLRSTGATGRRSSRSRAAASRCTRAWRRRSVWIGAIARSIPLAVSSIRRPAGSMRRLGVRSCRYPAAPGLAGNDRTGLSCALHSCPDARGRVAGGELRIGQVAGMLCDPGRQSVVGLRGRRRAAPRRRGCHRDGAVVDPCLGVAAAPGGIRPEGAQHRVRYRQRRAGGGALPRVA